MRVGPKGQVVIPKEIRDRLGIEPGDQVFVEENGGIVRVWRAPPPKALRGRLKDRRSSALRELEADHRWEIEHDERRQRQWFG